MIKYSSETPIKDRPRAIGSNLPGVDNSKIIESYPMLITQGVEVRFLWDNEITHFIKNYFIKLFRRR